MLSNGRLRFVESVDRYSVYERSDGTEVYLTNGYPRVELVEYDFDWVIAQWEEQTRGEYYNKARFWRRTFEQWLRDHLIEPDVVDDLVLCEYCENPTERDTSESTVGGGSACEDCIEAHYVACYDCSSQVRADNATTVYDEEVCSSCLDTNYSYCDHCEDYYHHDNSPEHDHDEDDDDDGEGCCESPALAFSMPNQGGTLQNDERTTVSLPSGHLDDEGYYAVLTYLGDQDEWAARGLLEGVGREWQTREGNLPKRLARALHKNNGSKLSPAIISEIGNIVSRHSRGEDFQVELTRDFNQSADYFYHEGSCWWSDYSAGRCALKSNGGIGLRTFGSYDRVAGRAWIMPLKVNESDELAPTFDAEGADAYVVFNAYGNVEGYSAPRIVAQMVGMSYHRVSFSCAHMYINNEAGYLVAPESVIENYRSRSLRLSVDRHSALHMTEQERELVDA